MIKTYDELYEKLKAENAQPYDEVYKLYVWEYPCEMSEDVPGTLAAYAKNIHDARDAIVLTYAHETHNLHVLEDWEYALTKANFIFNSVFKILLETDPEIYYNVNKGIFRHPGQLI